MTYPIFESKINIDDDTVVKTLKEIDLNSLVFFIGFMQYKTLYNTSLALDCSPALVSLMLKKFKNYFDVPLFSREGRQLTPTDFAIHLENEIYGSLKNILYIMGQYDLDVKV